ncbi:hypothetical protein BRADI_1g12226v3 [Brachypodium distachyon]|uniref:Uncharacterized protein n=1 Tax=Brachypodium distachyon TaxID=15368 RepID=A0A2K2DJ40_BRADI|nr:hypothetical protein BRADI_1g12226v3 [Brachypodium distachyon]
MTTSLSTVTQVAASGIGRWSLSLSQLFFLNFVLYHVYKVPFILFERRSLPKPSMIVLCRNRSLGRPSTVLKCNNTTICSM